MLIIWDEPKRLANLDKHGFDFADLEDGFDFETALAIEAPASQSGRRRVLLIGTLFDQLVVAIILSPLGSEAQSVVSMRVASSKERSWLWRSWSDKNLPIPKKT